MPPREFADMTNEELEAALATPEDTDGDEQNEQDEEHDDQDIAEDEGGDEEDESGDESNESGNDTNDEEPAGDKKADPKPGDKKKTVEVDAEEYALIQKRVADQASFIHKRNDDVGNLRKSLKEAQSTLDTYSAIDKQRLREMMEDDPEQAIQIMQDKKKAEGTVQETQSQIAVEEHRITCHQEISKVIPDFDDQIPEIIEIIEKDAGREIPWARKCIYDAPPELLVSLADRNKLRKEIEVLKTENERLKKKPGELARKLKGAADGGGTGPAPTRTVGKKRGQDTFKHLSDEELDAELMKSQSKESKRK